MERTRRRLPLPSPPRSHDVSTGPPQAAGAEALAGLSLPHPTRTSTWLHRPRLPISHRSREQAKSYCPIPCKQLEPEHGSAAPISLVPRAATKPRTPHGGWQMAALLPPRTPMVETPTTSAPLVA
eukprot:scaffold185964_cov34-Tisochrysis_lutea.AAC.5